MATQSPNNLSNEIYGMHHDYEGGWTKPFACFIGCKVNGDVLAPDGMDSLVILGQTSTNCYTRRNARMCGRILRPQI